MRIEFKREGGVAYFPGLSRPVVIDTDRLSPEEAGHLHALVEASRFFDQSEQVGTAKPGAADYRHYTIRIEAGDRDHTIRLVEPIADPGLRSLVQHLQKSSSTG